VTAEHAACFPEAGLIAIKSLQVKNPSLPTDFVLFGSNRPLPAAFISQVQHDGSLFYLTDSVPVEAAFRWVKGPWRLLVEARRELGSRPLARGDADCGSGGGSEQNAGVADVSDSPLLLQVDGNAEGVDHASDRHEDVEKHAMGQQKGGMLKAILQEDTSCQGVNHVSGQPEDGNVKTVLQESSDLDLAPSESEPRAKNQMDKSHKDAEHASSQYKDGNAKVMLEAGEGETSSMNQQDKSHEGVKHALGQHKNGDSKAMFQENPDLAAAAAGEGEIPPIDQLDKPHQSVKHALRQCKDGNVKTMPGEESSEFDVAASSSDTLPMNQMDKSRENDATHASEQDEDGTVNIMPKKASDLDESGAARDLPVQGQQKDAITEPRGMELFRKEVKNDENSIANCNDNISPLASPTAHINLAQEKSSRIQQENMNSDPLAYNQGSCSHGMGKKPSCDQKEPWTSGESINNGSDIPTFVQSMDRNNSSTRRVNTHKDDDGEPWSAGLSSESSDESSFQETDVPCCTKSMTESNERPASNDQFLRKRKYEGATSTVSKEEQPCFMRRRQQILTVRKMPMSKAAKIYGLR
jgi:hypothetical protein